MKNCTICKSELINERVQFRAKSYNEVGKPEGDIVIYEAWCPSCEINLTKKITGKNNGIWKSSTVEQENIEIEVSNEMIETLKKTINNLDESNDHFFLTKALWNEFINMRKEGDKIYSFRNSKEKGFVIVRENNRIGKFTDLLNLSK